MQESVSVLQGSYDKIIITIELSYTGKKYYFVAFGIVTHAAHS